MSIFTFWKDLDDDDKERIVKIIGILIAVFTVFTFLANVSYLFTWKADQSLLASDIGDKSLEVGNICGKLGFRWSYFLITKCFGLGSFALILILCAISIRLLLRRWSYSMAKTILLTLTGAMLASFILAFISSLTNTTNAFGGGLGGQCGAAVTSWAVNLFGSIVTGVILLALTVLWLLFASKKFKHWVVGLGKNGTDETEEEPAETEEPAEAETPKEKRHRKRHRGVPEPVGDDLANMSPDGSSRDTSIPLPAQDSSSAMEGQDTSIPLDGFENSADAGSSKEAPQGTLEIQRDENGLSTEVKKELEPYDSKTELPDYKPPVLDLLDKHDSFRKKVSDEEITRNNNKIRATLENFNIQIQDVKAIVGPTVTLYKVYPAPGVRGEGIKRIQDDIGMYLHAKGVRVIRLPDSVGIEVANDTPSVVPLRAVLNDEAFRTSKAELPVAIGYTIQQKVKVFDLAEAPHLLVAGATKQGKSVCLNVIISSLLYSKHPSELKFVFIDPKMVEFSAYEQLLHHYLAILPDFHDENEEKANSIVKNAKLAEKVLRSLCKEMDARYELLSKAYVQKITQYNDKFNHRRLRPDEGHRFLPYIVVVIDEYADLTMSLGGGGEDKAVARSISTSIIRLAQKGRAAGIHVIIATQRPSVDVITGLIKSNFPTRIAFRVVSMTDSRTILDSPGAEKLIGRGDMLYYAGVETERIQCALVTNEEISSITHYIGEQIGHGKSYNTPYYLPSVEDQNEDGEGGSLDVKNLDERFEEAARMVVTNQRGSTSDLQRRLGMGYAKAGRVMDQLEAAGIVGPQEGSRPRQVLISDLDELERLLESYRRQ